MYIIGKSLKKVEWKYFQIYSSAFHQLFTTDKNVQRYLVLNLRRFPGNLPFSYLCNDPSTAGIKCQTNSQPVLLLPIVRQLAIVANILPDFITTFVLSDPV